MRSRLALLALGLLLTGCGIGGSGSSTTATPAIRTAQYTDSKVGFSFRHPVDWSVPASGGRVVDVGGVQTYILDITLPDPSAQVSITMDHQLTPIPAFQDGHVSVDPNSPAHSFRYYHARLSGWNAMRIERFTGKQITEMDTIANTRTQSYDVRMLAANPPFSQATMAGYQTIVKTMRLPFS